MGSAAVSIFADPTASAGSTMISRASGGIGRREGFRCLCPWAWGFESPLAHQSSHDRTHKEDHGRGLLCYGACALGSPWRAGLSRFLQGGAGDVWSILFAVEE